MKISNEEQKQLALRLVRKTRNMNTPQGIDHMLLRAFEAATALRAFNQCGVKPDRIIETAIFMGNAYVAIINLGTILDKDKTADSLRKILIKFSCYIEEATCTEKKDISYHFQHLDKGKYTKGILDLRNEAFAHNSKTILNIDSLVIDNALQFSFRVWHLLNSLLPDFVPFLPYLELPGDNGTLKNILTQAEYEKFEKSWKHSVQVAKSWEITPL